MPPDTARQMYENMVEQTRKVYVKERVQSGIFGADMLVELQNDGPVTITLESPQEPPSAKSQKQQQQQQQKQQSDSTTETKSECKASTSRDESTVGDLTIQSKDDTPTEYPSASPTASTHATGDSERGNQSKQQQQHAKSKASTAPATQVSSQPQDQLTAEKREVYTIADAPEEVTSAGPDRAILIEDPSIPQQLQRSGSDCSAIAGLSTMYNTTELPLEADLCAQSEYAAQRVKKQSRKESTNAPSLTTKDDVNLAVSTTISEEIAGILGNPNRTQTQAQVNVDPKVCPASLLESSVSYVGETANTFFDTAGAPEVGSPSLSSQGGPDVDAPSPAPVTAVDGLNFHPRQAASVIGIPVRNAVLQTFSSEAGFVPTGTHAYESDDHIRVSAPQRVSLDREQELEAYKALARRQALDLALANVKLQEARRMANLERQGREKLHSYIRSNSMSAAGPVEPGLASPTGGATIGAFGTANSLAGADFVVAEGITEVEDHTDAEADTQVYSAAPRSGGRRYTAARTVYGGREARTVGLGSGAGIHGAASAAGGFVGRTTSGGAHAVHSIAPPASAVEHPDVEVTHMYSAHLGETEREASHAPIGMFDPIEVRSSAPRGLAHGHGMATVQMQVPLSMGLISQLPTGSYIISRPRASSEAGSVGSSSGSVPGMQGITSATPRPQGQARAATLRNPPRAAEDARHSVRANVSSQLATGAIVPSKDVRIARRSSAQVRTEADVDDELEVISVGDDVEMNTAVAAEIAMAEDGHSYGEVADASHRAFQDMKLESFQHGLPEDYDESHPNIIGEIRTTRDVDSSVAMPLRQRHDEGRSERGASRTADRRHPGSASVTGLRYLTTQAHAFNGHSTQYLDAAGDVNEHVLSPVSNDTRGSSRPLVNGTASANLNSLYPGLYTPSDYAHQRPHVGRALSEAPVVNTSNETRARIQALRQLISPSVGARGEDGESVQGADAFAHMRPDEMAELNALLDRLKVLVTNIQEKSQQHHTHRHHHHHHAHAESQSTQAYPASPKLNRQSSHTHHRVTSAMSSGSGVNVGRPRSATQSGQLLPSDVLERVVSLPAPAATTDHSRDHPHPTLRVRTSSPPTQRGINSPPPAPAPPRTPGNANQSHHHLTVDPLTFQAQFAEHDSIAGVGAPSQISVPSSNSANVGSTSAVSNITSLRGAGTPSVTATAVGGATTNRKGAPIFTPIMTARQKPRHSVDGIPSIEGVETTPRSTLTTTSAGPEPVLGLMGNSRSGFSRGAITETQSPPASGTQHDSQQIIPDSSSTAPTPPASRMQPTAGPNTNSSSPAAHLQSHGVSPSQTEKKKK